MKYEGIVMLRRIGLAIGVALLAWALAETLGNDEDVAVAAAIGGALVGFFIPLFQKKEVEKD